MQKKVDLIRQNCEHSLMQAGIEEACRAAAQPGKFPQINSFDRIRLRAADNIAALGFLRCLTSNKVPHKLTRTPGYREGTSYLPVIGGRTCIPVSQLISRRRLIRSCRKSPEQLLQGQVYLQSSGEWEVFGNQDLYIFIFVFALVTRSRDAAKKAVNTGGPLHLLFRMPLEWSLPEQWAPFQHLICKTDLSSRVLLTIHGLDGNQQYRAQQVNLPGRKRTQINTGFFSIGALGVDRLPRGSVGIHNPMSGETLLAAPYQWGNVWLYGIEMVIAGYIRHHDFHKSVQRISKADSLYANPSLVDEQLRCVPAAALRPMSDLFQRASTWTGN